MPSRITEQIEKTLNITISMFISNFVDSFELRSMKDSTPGLRPRMADKGNTRTSFSFTAARKDLRRQMEINFS